MIKKTPKKDKIHPRERPKTSFIQFLMAREWGKLVIVCKFMREAP